LGYRPEREKNFMRILIAEDDRVSRHVLLTMLVKWGYDVVAVNDGAQAWQELQKPRAPHVALLDWMMPQLDGFEVVQRVRRAGGLTPTYFILLTARAAKEDMIAALEAGADDYVTKPFDQNELRARLQVGLRVVDLQLRLADRVQALEESLNQVKLLQGLLPICSYCKKVRGDGNYWHQVEQYIAARSEAQFSHSICPDCWIDVVKPDLAKQGIAVPDKVPAMEMSSGTVARQEP
jgi:sigma-B regulation protein RsbU (phosphoserine phosphatase)